MQVRDKAFIERIRKMKTILSHLKIDSAHRRNIALCLAAVFGMGFFLSLLIPCDLGTDPFTFMNVSVSERLHMTFGNWQLLLNVFLFIPVILKGRDQIGLGTLANMVGIGYISDFFRWVWARVLPQAVFTDFPARGVLFAVTLFGFILSAAVYMNADMGVAPFDADATLLSRLFPRIPFMFVRMAWDGLTIVVGMLCGGTPTVGAIIMVFALGPVITAVGNFLRKKVLS